MSNAFATLAVEEVAAAPATASTLTAARRPRGVAFRRKEEAPLAVTGRKGPTGQNRKKQKRAKKVQLSLGDILAPASSSASAPELSPFADEAVALKALEGLPRRAARVQQVRSCRCAGYERCQCPRVTQYSCCGGASSGGRIQFSTAGEAVEHLATHQGFVFLEQQDGHWVWNALVRQQRQRLRVPAAPVWTDEGEHHAQVRSRPPSPAPPPRGGRGRPSSPASGAASRGRSGRSGRSKSPRASRRAGGTARQTGARAAGGKLELTPSGFKWVAAEAATAGGAAATAA
jgi:hypothetical protein